MQTIKFKIQINQRNKIIEYQKEYSNLLHYCFNYFNGLDDLKTLYDYKYKSSTLMQNINKLNNIKLLNNWFIQCCISQAYQLIKSYQYKIEEYKYKKDQLSQLLNKDNKTYKDIKQIKKLQKIKYPKVVFGGHKNFKKRCEHQISNQQFKLNRLNPLYSIGTAKPYKGNQKFRLKETLDTIIFQPKCKQKYELKLFGITKGYRNILQKLYKHQQNKDLPITYKLSKDYIYISFEQKQLYNYNIKRIKDRYCSLDLNPNYIGYSIIDWNSSNSFKIIDKGVYSFKQLNNIFYTLKGTNSSDSKRIYLTNKRNYQVIEVAKNIINKCNYYKVQNFIVEDLNIKKQDLNKGKDYNRLIHNNWIRNKFLNNIIKRCNIFNINYLEVLPQYSSFVGNLIFRYLNLPDMVLSSIQISRRGYEYRHQYILKDKEIKKNIVKIDINNDKVFKDLYNKSLEEFNIQETFKNIIDTYHYFNKRNSKLSYRISLDTFSKSFSRFLTNQSRLLLYNKF